MAGERVLPGLGLVGFWDLGSDGWKDGMDGNLRVISATSAGSVKSRTTPLPASPILGDIYIVPVEDLTHPNKIAVWDGPVGLEEWVFLEAKIGSHFLVLDDNENVQWDGTNWTPFAASGGTGTTVSNISVNFFAGGTHQADEALGVFSCVVDFTLPAGLSGSKAVALVPGSATDTVFELRKNGTAFGSVTFAVGSSTGTLDATSSTVFTAGDIMSVHAPSSANATLSDVSITLLGDL